MYMQVLLQLVVALCRCSWHAPLLGGWAAVLQAGTHEGFEGTHEGMKGLSSTATGPERLACPMPISCFHSRPLAPAAV